MLHFVFPVGVSLVESTQPPRVRAHDFMLSDETGRKRYGVAVLFFEELDTIELVSLFASQKQSPLKEEGKDAATIKQRLLPKWVQRLEAMSGSNSRRRHASLRSRGSTDLQQSKVFSPKALVLISSHPFLSTLRLFALQLLRIARCASPPLPLERYVGHFMRSVPLPPRGRKCVLYTVADRVCLISRPPPNKLRGVDFSFRPLFCCLSVDYILIVIAWIMARVAERRLLSGAAQRVRRRRPAPALTAAFLSLPPFSHCRLFFQRGPSPSTNPADCSLRGPARPLPRQRQSHGRRDAFPPDRPHRPPPRRPSARSSSAPSGSGCWCRSSRRCLR